MVRSWTQKPFFARIAVLAGVGAAGLSTAPPASAQMDPATQRLIEQLRPQTPGVLEGTRGIRRPGQANEAPAAAPSPTPAPEPAPAPVPAAMPAPRPAPVAPPTTTAPAGVSAVSIRVLFESGSDAISPAARRDLDALGRALSSSELARFRFRIEGHTDTVGPADLNLALSERRAMRVREYLEANFGIPRSRLEVAGLGESQLLVATPDGTPNAANRRVQVINLGS